MAMTGYEICPAFCRELHSGEIDCMRLPGHKAHLANVWKVLGRDSNGFYQPLAELPTRAAAERWLADHRATSHDHIPDARKMVIEPVPDIGADRTQPSEVWEEVPDPLICEVCARKRHHVIPRGAFPTWRTCACEECKTVTDVTAWSGYAAVRRTRNQVAP